MQRRYGEENKCCVIHVLLFTSAMRVNELEILKVWEESDEIRICREEPLAQARARNRSVGARCLK